MEKRLPWFLKSRFEKGKNLFYYFKIKFENSFQRPGSNSKDLLKITFVCGFHGETGGAFAIANIANLLAKNYNVRFVSFPFSNYNKALDNMVSIVRAPSFDSDLFICDVSCDHEFLESLRSKNKKVIVSCHGFLNDSHGLLPERVSKSLALADKVHFVSKVQQDSFNLPDGKFDIIPNTTKKIRKTIFTRNVGTVGSLDNPRKNAEVTVAIALKSKAELIHLWSAKNDKWKHAKVIVHPWEGNRNKIYDSFDVLVFMSQVETFGLVVIEAMSAGIPCLLSDIPAFEVFRDCPGVYIVDSSKTNEATKLLDEILRNKENLRHPIASYFDQVFSEKQILKKWVTSISNLMEQ